jgi:hypothetical protein
VSGSKSKNSAVTLWTVVLIAVPLLYVLTYPPIHCWRLRWITSQPGYNELLSVVDMGKGFNAYAWPYKTLSWNTPLQKPLDRYMAWWWDRFFPPPPGWKGR